MSGDPVVFGGISLPRPSNPVVLEGSPLFAMEFASSGTAISVSLIQWVLLVPAGLVAIMDVWVIVVVVYLSLFPIMSFVVCSSHGTSIKKVLLVLWTKVGAPDGAAAVVVVWAVDSAAVWYDRGLLVRDRNAA